LDLGRRFRLHFEPPDFERFPALTLAYDVARKAGTAGGRILNAAKEAAVDAFIGGHVSFGEISRLVGLTIDAHQLQATPPLTICLAADRLGQKSGAIVVPPGAVSCIETRRAGYVAGNEN